MTSKVPIFGLASVAQIRIFAGRDYLIKMKFCTLFENSIRNRILYWGGKISRLWGIIGSRPGIDNLCMVRDSVKKIVPGSVANSIQRRKGRRLKIIWLMLGVGIIIFTKFEKD